MGFDQIKAMRDEACKQIPYERVHCPICSWPLEKRERDGVLHCPFDGWTYPAVITRKPNECV